MASCTLTRKRKYVNQAIVGVDSSDVSVDGFQSGKEKSIYPGDLGGAGE